MKNSREKKWEAIDLEEVVKQYGGLAGVPDEVITGMIFSFADSETIKNICLVSRRFNQVFKQMVDIVDIDQLRDDLIKKIDEPDQLQNSLLKKLMEKISCEIAHNGGSCFAKIGASMFRFNRLNFQYSLYKQLKENVERFEEECEEQLQMEGNYICDFLLSALAGIIAYLIFNIATIVCAFLSMRLYVHFILLVAGIIISVSCCVGPPALLFSCKERCNRPVKRKICECLVGGSFEAIAKDKRAVKKVKEHLEELVFGKKPTQEMREILHSIRLLKFRGLGQEDLKKKKKALLEKLHEEVKCDDTIIDITELSRGLYFFK